jgi:type III pantothenate kinase
MLFVIDIGNTNIVLGVYRGEELIAHWRLATKKQKTADEYGVLVHDLFRNRGLDPAGVDGAVLSCVVPPLHPVIESVCREYFGIAPLVVEPGIKTGIPIRYDNPKEVGADRIVNAVAAFHKFGGPLIVVDFGTATTFDAITTKGEYLGGAISPGVGISMEALFLNASKLPRIELVKPPSVIGKNTIHSMQSGIFYGYVGLVDEIVARMKAELGGKVRVVATGGLSVLIAPESRTIDATDPMLTLEGLRLLYGMNPPKGKGKA